MHRNNFLPHVALALVLILVAAFAGQLRRWQKEWKAKVHIMPATEKIRTVRTSEEAIRAEPAYVGEAEVLVRFKSGVSAETINKLVLGLHDRIEDQIEAVPGLKAIDDLDDEDADLVAATYRNLPEVEYAEPNYEINLDGLDSASNPVLPSDPKFSDQWDLY